MSNDEKVIGIAAEFHKDSGGRLKLFSLWARTVEVSSRDGKTYFGADGYDVEWSKRLGGYVFHNSSSGFHKPEISGIYFLWGDMEVKLKPCQLVDARDKPPWRSKRTKAIRERNRTRRLRRLPKSFDMKGVGNLLEWLQQNALESDCEYCSECCEYIPTCEEWNLCDHIWWCEKKGFWSTPTERCDCKSREECDGDE